MFDYKRGIKVGFLSHIIVYIIFGIWTTFLSIPYISSISYYTSNINMGQIAFMLYIYGIFWGAIYGVIIGVLFARFYEKIPGLKSNVKGIIIALIFWIFIIDSISLISSSSNTSIHTDSGYVLTSIISSLLTELSSGYLLGVFWNRFQQKQELKKLKSSLPSDNYPQVVNATTSQPVISQSVITQEITPDNTINDELKIILQTFKKQHPALNVADIENLLETKDNQSIKKAEVLLSQRKKEYEHYIKTENDLKETNARITNLTRRLADGNIDSEAYKRARDDLEQEKKKLEEGLWKLRSILFKEDYEKPY